MFNFDIGMKTQVIGITISDRLINQAAYLASFGKVMNNLVLSPVL